jgi:hypothetical protein
LNVTLPKGDRSQEFIADIEAAKDIDKLRHQAQVLVEMRKSERDYSEALSLLVDRLFQWLWMLVAVCGAGLLTNAAALWWICKGSPSTGRQNAL